MDGWRDGGMKGWRDAGVEEWRGGGMMEEWRGGGMEGRPNKEADRYLGDPKWVLTKEFQDAT